ncbi:MAG: hypothetical protein H7296_03870 [Bacteroidia bacterium]|nr:hypothetical protein [Bacteroidia bacterium]
MKKLLSVTLVLFFLLQLAAPAKAQTPNPNPKNIEIAHRFTYILDNGFEKIDLMKVPDIDKSFFNIGNAQLIICEKNDTRKKNLLNSFTLIVEPSDPNEQSKVFSNPSPTFTSVCKQFVTGLKPKSKITFSEVKLNTSIPVTNSQAPGSKYGLPMGMLPVAFFLYIK